MATHKSRIMAVGALVLCIAGWSAWSFAQKRRHPVPPLRIQTQSIVTNVVQPPSQNSAGLAAVCATLKTRTSGEQNFQALQNLTDFLDRMPADQASAEIGAFLDSKMDAPTGLPFKIRAGGFLATWPTMRIFLLDYLGKRNPDAAANYTLKIVESADSADEWAVALRNYAKLHRTPEAALFLEEKFKMLLHHDSWSTDPSTGFLEAFDVAVYLGGTNLIGVLAQGATRKDAPALAHASYLALDRLAISQTALTLNSLQMNPALLQGRELTRASYFARADVRDTRQREILERYLLNRSISGDELNRFANLFPNQNYMVSNNLLTDSKTPGGDEISSRDTASIRVIEQWQNDSRFRKLAPQLERVRARLQRFIRN